MATIAWVQVAGTQVRPNTVKFHHELRGTILRVDRAKSEFTIETYEKKTVECIVNSKTVFKNNAGKRIKFGDLRPGDRAYCHCQEMRDGKHYSVYLLVQTSDVQHTP